MITKAKESSQVERARRKIEERLMEEKEKLTPELMREAVDDIHHWLERHSKERVSLKDRTIYRGVESTKSKFILHLMQRIQKGLPSKSKLEGRITKKEQLPQNGLGSGKKVHSKPK